MAPSVVQAVAGAAATTLAAMYLDAKLLIQNDIFSGALSSISNASVDYLAERVKQDRMTIYDNLLSQAQDPVISDKIFLIFESREWTYRQFHDAVTRVGNWLMSDLGIQRDEIVALDGGNSPEFILLWMALDGIGARIAFINCNLTSDALVHCVNVGECRILLVDEDVKHLVQPVEDRLAREGGKDKSGTTAVYYKSGFADTLTGPEYQTLIPHSRRSKLDPTALGLLIYTSGTTGLPKGTIMVRGRWLITAWSIQRYLNLAPGNRMYTCLPLYHGAALGLCVTPSIQGGSTVVLSRKFSHRTFWPEIRESKADIMQYVGELCRYLVNTPPKPGERDHNVKRAWGNGMRPDVWDVFRERFGIEYINELYAATDGLGGSFNNNRGEFGKYAVGKRGLIWKLLNSKNEKRVKMDVVTQEMLRDENGFAIEAKDGEPGEVVHRLFPDRERMMFAGYLNNETAGEKRKVRDLFQKGDYWFRSGDMMRQDPDGCVYFVDRLGDTFRWKSENVSTNEVADTLSRHPQIHECNVYGVLVPHADGRAGCAAITLSDPTQPLPSSIDFTSLSEHALAHLPRYAVPVFIRVIATGKMEVTGTMKQQKGKLREQGINLDEIAASASADARDAMYWLPPGGTLYVPFKHKEWEELKGGRVRL